MEGEEQLTTEKGEGEEQLRSRPYQSQLEEIAVAKNTIIHLPTGSGKTFIAISLINRLKGAFKKPWGQGGKRTFFLVNTIPLVMQQKKVIERMSAVRRVAGYSGEDGVDYWDKAKWDAELDKYQVVVMTSQILADMLTHAYIRIEDINLLVFDECHHAVVDHPMRLIMKHFEDCPPDGHPRVLGLTATLLNANTAPARVHASLHELETTFHATIATVNELGEVLHHSTNPRESIMSYETAPPAPAAAEAIRILQALQELVMDVRLPRAAAAPGIKLERWERDITTDPKKLVKEVRNMAVSMVMFIEELGVFGGSVGVLAYIILLERLKRKAISAQEEQLFKLARTHCLAARMVLLAAMERDAGYERIVRHSSHKVLLLINILKEYNPEKYTVPGVMLKVNTSRKPLAAIIFTRQRFTAKVLFNVLKAARDENPAELGFLRHDFIVGFNINPTKSTREQYFLKKSSETALLKFCNKDLNCLISTSVIEEGVDIPQCSLVLRFDPPVEYRSYIQSKGRARCAESSYVMLVERADRGRFDALYQSFQHTEIYLQKMLVGKTDERGAPTEDDIRKGLYDDEIPPYVTEHGTRLSAVSAISLLNRYCSVLPHDQFTSISPMWVQETVRHPAQGELCRVKIIMPVACPVKEPIEGLPMSSLKGAKRAAALAACARLHAEGELARDTLLPRRYGVVDFDQEEVRACLPNWPWGGEEEEQGQGEGAGAEGEQGEGAEPEAPRPGSKRYVRRHRKVFPACLRAPAPAPGAGAAGARLFHLHVVRARAAFPRPAEPRERACYELLRRPEGYGLLSPRALPQLCDFPMYLTAGEVATHLQVNYAVVPLDAPLLELVKRFHLFLFDRVLEVAKPFAVFSATENWLFAVPLRPDGGGDGAGSGGDAAGSGGDAADAGERDIDWELMREHVAAGVRPVAPPADEERRSLRVRPEEYLHHVVSPWYRGALLPARYIVSRVLEHLTPGSQFEVGAADGGGGGGGTYADYYDNKYNLRVLGPRDQPLLEVRNISSRMNCLVPRAATLRALSDKQRKLVALAHGEDKPMGFPEVFVPEFCIRYTFPGHMWYKAVMLPSIVHRVTMLLSAHELRTELAQHAGEAHPHLPPGAAWLPMVTSESAAAAAMLAQVDEPPPLNTVDRINDPIDCEAPRPVIVTMKESIYQYQKKKISRTYPWDEEKEPRDIERDLLHVTVMDLECYDEFVSAPMPPFGVGAPAAPAPAPRAAPALLPPPEGALPSYYDPEIRLLSAGAGAGAGVELRDVAAALTTANSNDTCDLERVETLGDSFLKFAAALYLYQKFPKLSEGQLTNIKGRLVGNRNLYYAGANRRLGGRMKAEQFSPRKDFLVPGFLAPKEVREYIEAHRIRPTFLIGMSFTESEVLSGRLSEASAASVRERGGAGPGAEREPRGGAQPAMQCYLGAQAVSDKSVADCVEALVGTYLLSGGVRAAVGVLEWLAVLPPQDEFTRMLRSRAPTVLQRGLATEEEIDRVTNHCREDVERALGYTFRDPSYLLEALSHPSYIRNRLTRSYERLEFLGDAVLDFLITAHVFEHCRGLRPGQLTDLRSALVNNVTFASYVVRLGLHKYICYTLNPVLESAIMTFVEHQERGGHEIVEDVLYLIGEEECRVAEYVEVPKVLSDIFESLVGAMYLDSGGQLPAVWAAVYRIMHAEIHRFARDTPLQPVRVLHERIHACPSFGKPLVPDAALHKVVVPVTFTRAGRRDTVYGCGANKFQAKRAAAKLALKILGM